VEERIVRAGARPGTVRVVAVSKTYPASTVVAAQLAGFADFGESFAAEFAAKAARVAELDAKLPATTVPQHRRWHFIGQLQTNKVRVVAPFADVYQSVDRSSLVGEIAKRAAGASVMIQVNLAGAEGRGGASWEDAPATIELARSSGLDVVGVMGVAPLAGEREVASSFRRLRALADAEGLAECSMGMSDDLEIAVAEGSTMVRVGSAIFGARPPAR
jgi:pyridoxal phosphate enzyme (YggS family)